MTNVLSNHNMASGICGQDFNLDSHGLTCFTTYFYFLIDVLICIHVSYMILCNLIRMYKGIQFCLLYQYVNFRGTLKY